MLGFKKWRSIKTAALCAILTILIPASLMAQEAGDELGDISLSDLLNLKVSVATKSEMTVEEAPSIVSVITANEIRNMGARSLTDVLRTVPGFDLTHQVTIEGHKVKIRGLGRSTSIKMLMNGSALNYYNGRFDMIPLNSVRRIEIIRGPGSALYGTGAFFGIINIITKEGGDEPSKVTLAGGSHSTLKPSAELSCKDRDLSVYLYGDYYRTDGYDAIVESDTTSNSQSLASSAPGELTDEVRYYNLQANISYKNFYLTGLFCSSKMNSPVGIAKALTDENEVRDKYFNGELGYKKALAGKGHLMFRMYYDRFELDRLWEVFPEETAELDIHTNFPEGEGLNGRPMSKYSHIGGEIQGDYTFSMGIQIVGGMSYDYSEVFDVKSLANHNVIGSPLEVDGITYPGFPFRYFHTGWTDISEKGNWLDESDRTVRAVYTQGIFDLKKLFSLTAGVESLSFTAGFRHDDYDDVGSTTNPRFGIVWAPTKKLHFKALYGTAFRAPDPGELYVKNNPALTGNRDLKPEELETAEFLMGYNLTRNIRANITCFNVKTDNLIIVRNRSYANEGKAESSGVEAEMRMRFGKFRYAYLNFTWQDVKNTTPDNTIISAGGQSYTQGDFNPGGVPEFYGNIGVNCDFFDEHVIANLSLNYVGERERSEEKKWDDETLVRSDQREPTKDRTLVNASLTFRNFYKGLEAQISCFNMFDTDHRDPDNALYYDMPEAGRWFTARISYSF